MGGASQGNQGISFGARRQITSQSPTVPSAAEKDRKRREKEAEDARLKQQAEENEHKRRVEREAEEERERMQQEFEEKNTFFVSNIRKFQLTLPYLMLLSLKYSSCN